MTALVILIVMTILLWLIAQSIVLTLLWGQQQRSRARADLLATLLGASPLDKQSLPEQARQEPPRPETKHVPVSTPQTGKASQPIDEPERGEPVPELIFPPPVRQPVVPPAGVPAPRRDEVSTSAISGAPPQTASSSGSDPARAVPNSDVDRAAREREHGESGLPAGSVLPDFELPTIDGESFGRSRLIGARVVLLFLGVDSPGSSAVMESIRSPQVRKRSLPDLVLVINGGVETASLRRWLGKLPKRVTVLLQDDTELATVLRVSGTPCAYVLDDQAQTRGPLRTGARAVLEALGVSTSQMSASARRSTNLTAHAQITQRTYSGLPVGSLAPDVILPLIGGGTWQRSADQPSLLIFWDAHCPPCQTMQTELVDQAPSWTGFDPVVIARGIPAGTTMLPEFEGHLPVSLQRGFDVSRLFHVLEAPAAVVIGVDGAIARPPAIGASAVLALAGDLNERSRRIMNASVEGAAP